MSAKLLRLGLYLILLTLAAYVFRDRSPLISGVAKDEVLELCLIAGAALLVASLIARLMHRSTPRRPTGRCAVCRTTVSKKEIYCRKHLAEIVEAEEARSPGFMGRK